MTRITIEVDDDVAEQMRQAAAERGVTAEQLLSEDATQRYAPRRRKLGFVSLGSSTSGRTAAEDEDMLAEGFGR